MRPDEARATPRARSVDVDLARSCPLFLFHLVRSFRGQEERFGAFGKCRERDGARLLGTITEKEDKAVATAWKNRVYLLCAQAAPD